MRVLSAEHSEYSQKIGHTLGIGRLVVVKWRGCVGDGVDVFDRLVKCAVLGDILDNDKLKAVTIVGKFVDEKRAFRQGANCAADGVACFYILVEHPSGEIIICTCDEDLGWGRDGDHDGGIRFEESGKVRNGVVII